MNTKNFALIGAAGYVAPRHMKAINDTGHKLLAAVDPFDSVGVLDRYFPEARFFTEIERFDRYMEKLRRRHREEERIHYVSICSPNYLHDAHVRLALRLNAHAICEKPLVISPWNIDQLAEIEQEHGCRVFTVLQLRLHPPLIHLREKLQAAPDRKRADVVLTYVTRRGPWYMRSWKGTQVKSGGLGMNIGIHFFDLLYWIFGKPERTVLHLNESTKMSGVVDLEWARVRWFLSVDENDRPQSYIDANKPAFRSITIDGEELDFSDGFTDLHTRVYEDILNGGGFGLEDARPSIELVHNIRNADIKAPAPGEAHPLVLGKKLV